MRATYLPTLPYAWMPIFLPRSSVPSLPLNPRRASVIIRPNTSSATAFEFCPGVFMATTPLAEAAFRSMLS